MTAGFVVSWHQNTGGGGATGAGAHQGQTSPEGEKDIWWMARTARGGTGHLGLTETQRGRLWTACGQRCVDSKHSQTASATTSTSSIRQLLGAADTQTAHPATSSTAPAHQPLGSANAQRHQQEHRPQRPTESSDPTQHAKGRTGDCPGPRKGTTTRRNVTQGACFVVGCRDFPRDNFFCAIWGTSCSLRILRGGGSRALLRCGRRSVCVSRPFVLPMGWGCSKFGSGQSFTNRLSTRNQRWGVSKFPASDGPAPKLEVGRNLPLTKIFPRTFLDHLGCTTG